MSKDIFDYPKTCFNVCLKGLSRLKVKMVGGGGVTAHTVDTDIVRA